jgi:hypothetical protein
MATATSKAKPKKPKLSVRQLAEKYGYRSGLEQVICEQLDEQGVEYEYESFKIDYEMPATKHKYTPDIKLANGIIVEIKGRLVPADRKKHVLIKKQHPEYDIRFVFQYARAPILKGSKTTYAMWAEKNGFLWADKTIPQEWIDEPSKDS